MKKYAIYWLALAVVLITGCQKEESFELGGAPGEGTLQSEITGDCLPKTVNGVYEAGKVLVPNTNTISVDINVTKTGTYTITTDTVNGYFFKGTGRFTTLGVNTVILQSQGTPFADGINNFVVSYLGTFCDIQVDVLPAGAGGPAVFTLVNGGSPANCATAVVAGTYLKDVAVTSANYVDVTVNVTAIGTYTITATGGGLTFTKTAAFTATGNQTIRLQAAGTPPTVGPNTITFAAPFATCNFSVNVVAPVTGTLGGAPGTCTPVTPNGTYTQGVALTAANTIQIQITTAAVGAYSISTNTVAGISFSGSGTTTGATQTITLAGTGTPTASGPQFFTVTYGTSTCTFTLPIGTSAPAAVFTINCPGVVVNGTYQVGVNLTAANTIVIPINLTTPGSYSVTTSVNGMSFSFSGNLTAGTTSVTLVGNTANAPSGPAGIYNLSIGSPACLIPITVTAASTGAAYTPNCSAPMIMGLYEATTQLNVSNVIDINVNVTATGPYSFTIPAVNGMTFTASGNFASTGPATIRLLGSGTPTAGGNFNITVPGTTPCSFQLTVDATPVIDWKFTVTNPTPAITYQGQTDQAELQTSGGLLVFGIQGSNSDGTDDFIMGFTDLNTINAGETYSTSAGTAAFSYAIVTANGTTSTDPYVASPSTAGVSVVFTVSTHNTTTKTITGTFSGTAKNTAGQIITITNGTFRGTYL